MPSIVGPVKINNVSNAAITYFGDGLNLAPKNISKTYGGAGAFPTGDWHVINNFVSNTNVADPDASDETLISAN